MYTIFTIVESIAAAMAIGFIVLVVK